MSDRIEELIRQAIRTIGDHRDEAIALEVFHRKFVATQRKALIFTRCKWFGISLVSTAPWWWPEEWAIGEGITNVVEFFRALFTAPAFIEAVMTQLNPLIG